MARATTRRRRNAALTLEQMRLLPRLPAAEPVPESVWARQPTPCMHVRSRSEPRLHATPVDGAGSGLWCVRAEGDALLTPHIPGRALTAEEGRPGRRMLGATTTGWCPPWADTVALTELLPVTLRDRAVSSVVRNQMSPVAIATVAHRSRRARAEENAMRFTYPWSTIGFVQAGRLSTGSIESTGSGVLVGPNLLLTASHVIPWDVEDWWMSFIPAYNTTYPVGDSRRAPFGWEYVERIRGRPEGPTGNPTGTDYAICKLRKPLGQRLGWMGTIAFGDEDDYEDNSWISVGYPGGRLPIAQFDLRIRDIDDDRDGLELETDLFPALDFGWSGGPLWAFFGSPGNPKVAGVAAGRERDGLDPRRMVFAGGSPLVNLTRFGLANWLP